MFVRVEPTGCCERKGLVQIRFCMYLDKGDYGYEKHYVQVLNSLPKVWQLNPFHNHFIYVEPEITDKEIMEMGEKFLKWAYAKWTQGEKLNLHNPPVKFHISPIPERLLAVNEKVKYLKETILERRIGTY